MTHARTARTDDRPPTVGAPPRFVDRRTTFRRAADQVARRETVLLARSLDVLAASGPAEDRLVGLLRLLASTVGARRAAVVAGEADRRVVADAAGDDGAAERLATWLDAQAPRTRPARAAAGFAPIAIVGRTIGDAVRAVPAESAATAPDSFACVAVPSAGHAVIGFAFGRRVDDDELARRLPPQLARHAAVALALVTNQLAAERDLEQLRARDEERTRFVSTVAHELRTPLTGLSGYLDLILEGKVDDPEVQRDFLERGQSIVDTMGELVGDLLELSRLESGTIMLEVGALSVADACGRVVEGLESIALRRGIRLTSDPPPRLRSATGDRRRVEQILTNLAANALKFAPAGSTVELAGRFDGPVAVIVVRDEGSGIEAEARTRIFERFYRMSGHERITGTGLGLPIARDLARAMGGDLDVASVPGSGSAFVLVLPGPAQSDPAGIGSVMARAVAAEEIRLEEAAVLRAIHASGRSVPRPRLLKPDSTTESADQPATEDRQRIANPPGRPYRSAVVRLRAVDGRPSRAADPSPA